MTMKIDLTQPTIKVENAKGVSYTGKITKFTFIGSGASIDFMTKDAVLIMDIHVPDAVVPEVVNRMLNRRYEDVTITCMRNADEDDNIAMAICDVDENEEEDTPIYYSVTGTLESVVTYEKPSIYERALVTIKEADERMQFWVQPSIHTIPRDVFHLIRELEFIEKNNEELNYPTFIFLYHKKNDKFVLDGIQPSKYASVLFTDQGNRIISYYKKDLKALQLGGYVIFPKDKYEINPIIGVIQNISYDSLYNGSFVLTVYDKYGEGHTIYMTSAWNFLGKFLFDNLIDMTGKVDNEFAFFTKKMNYEGKEINYLTGLYKE